MQRSIFFKEKFLKNNFVKNIFILSFSTVIAQLINILFTPIISRTYSPENFGFFSLIRSIITILAIVATGQYDQALFLPKDDQEARWLSIGSFFLTVSFSIIVCVFIIFLRSINILLNDFIYFCFIVPLGILFFSTDNILTNYLIRNKKYRYVGQRQILKSIINVSLIVIFALLNLKYVGLILSFLISSLIINIYLFFQFSIKLKDLDFKNIFHLFKNYIKFPKYDMLSSLINIFSSSLPIFLFTLFYNREVVGSYSFTNNLLAVPMTFIGVSVSKVFYQECSTKTQENESISNFVKKVFDNLINLIIVPMFVAVVFGDILFSFLFGQQWKMAGQFAQFLALWQLMIFISSPLSNLLRIYNKQNILLFWNIIMIVLRFLSIWFGWFISKNPLLSIIFFSITGSIGCLLLVLYILKISKVDFSKEIVRKLTISSLILIPLILLRLVIKLW